jgi:hypothetical protein
MSNRALQTRLAGVCVSDANQQKSENAGYPTRGKPGKLGEFTIYPFTHEQSHTPNANEWGTSTCLKVRNSLWNLLLYNLREY